jgi:hypothetical protein
MPGCRGGSHVALPAPCAGVLPTRMLPTRMPGPMHSLRPACAWRWCCLRRCAAAALGGRRRRSVAVGLARGLHWRLWGPWEPKPAPTPPPPSMCSVAQPSLSCAGRVQHDTGIEPRRLLITCYGADRLARCEAKKGMVRGKLAPQCLRASRPASPLSSPTDCARRSIAAASTTDFDCLSSCATGQTILPTAKRKMARCRKYRLHNASPAYSAHWWPWPQLQALTPRLRPVRHPLHEPSLPYSAAPSPHLST